MTVGLFQAVTCGAIFGLLGCSNTPHDGDETDPCKIPTGFPSEIPVGGIFTLTSGGSSTLEASNQDAFDMAIAEINRGCGTIGTTEGGSKLTGLVRDGEDDRSLAATVTDELITQGVAFLVGAGGTAPTTDSLVLAAAHNIPYGMYFATGDELTRCTTAELIDPAVEKTSSPVFDVGKCWDNGGISLRTATTSSAWGVVAGDYVLQHYPNVRKVAFVYRNDGASPPFIASFERTFEAAGDGREVIAQVAFETTAVEADFVAKIITATSGEPELIMFLPRISHVGFFFEAWARLATEVSAWGGAPKPAGFDSVSFVISQSAKSDYGELSDAAVQIMAGRCIGVQPAWDETREGFRRWLAGYESFVPGGVVQIHTQLRAYDATMILALAMTKAGSSDADAIKAEVMQVATPPGELVYPGEFARARQLLMLGADIDYEGASGPVDLLDNGNVSSTAFEVWQVDANGAPRTIEILAM